MQSDHTKILVESIKRLLRWNAKTHIQKIVDKTHAADLSLVFPFLPINQQCKFFELIEDPEKKGALFRELEEDISITLIENMELDNILEVLEYMPSDDVADLIDRLPDEKSDAILEKMKMEGSEKIKELLCYRKDTAGGIMVPDFIALKEETTAKEAIESLQKEHLDVEMP
ncbi:MAG: magnesium transporter, partial [Thermodesulfobacteriota bacterium]|nr:magnesium transporter [Thermodesulfobacteriota bacterium]